MQHCRLCLDRGLALLAVTLVAQALCSMLGMLTSAVLSCQKDVASNYLQDPATVSDVLHPDLH